ncbi:hypothetical protein L7E55_09540 [Pelotomaculum isophthalicicum JI]|uniref:Uncharacterized protein n=1 Tax=Pelotomaculum isophthalicicum JI TaxID=947010 RepID=A0A9X4H254_9FIRM|nr:hypothetical protein [Pelotomaculum isophthalicicum]MDF9408595.1 hypothetical protein [Pelotomaculum isophthalicicum JI]
MAKPVGFDQKIKLRHLDYIAREASSLDRKNVHEKLDEFLNADIRGAKSRKNAVTVLMKIWYLTPGELKSLRQRALELLPSLSFHDRLVFHWGMTLLAYPFFKDVVNELGTLFRLQNEVPSRQIGRKVKSLYGDRRRVEVATTAVLMSIKSWGLIERSKSNIYTLPKKYEITNAALKLWLAEVVLRVSDCQYMPLEMIPAAQFVFPFQFKINIREFEHSNFIINRQGLDMQLVGL